jgi:hypothetical protein
MLISQKWSCTIMLLPADVTLFPRAPRSRNGSMEHLFALINLCLLIKQHETLILASSVPNQMSVCGCRQS